MRLFVSVIRARNLLAMDSNGLSDPYVKLQLGKQKHRTKVIKMNLNPSWNQEFNFDVGDLRDALKISLYDEDMLGMDDFLGRLVLPVERVLMTEGMSLGTQWYKLLPRDNREAGKDCGEILLGISMSKGERTEFSRSLSDDLFVRPELEREMSRASHNTDMDPSSRFTEVGAAVDDRTSGVSVCDDISRDGRADGFASGMEDPDEESSNNLNVKGDDVAEEDASSSHGSFDGMLKLFESSHQGTEMPLNLKGGILLDQCYDISPSDLNAFLFSPTSSLRQAVAEVQGVTSLQLGHWGVQSTGDKLTRVITFMTAPSKMIKSVPATEEQMYLKADEEGYAVLTSVSTPDVPCGSLFRTEVLFCIKPGPVLPSGSSTSCLVISWQMNFLQSTFLKGAIENGAKQGLKDSFSKFGAVLSEHVKPVDVSVAGSPEKQASDPLQAQPESLWKLAHLYLGNLTVLSSVFMVIYMLVHLSLARHSTLKGLEFSGIDLPDSLSEILIGGILVLQGQRVLKKITRFVQATERRGGDHGTKAKGDGWLLTVSLIEGSKLAPVDQTGYSDPYVEFTCGGRKKTSSIKFQTLEPQWNEIFEFDAMDDPPSLMNIKVFDFDGPFEEATSLGHAEINFLKLNISELSDVWVPLEGNLAQSWQSKLHLRIFLKNTKGIHVSPDYLNRMEKEVGTKIAMRSPQTNSEFQKIFSLPPEEFLISDFSCYLRRKIPTQGRLFLSPRIIGFYSSMFGQKIKFFFLWEDIEDIQIGSSSFTTLGSPVLAIVLRRGKGMDAQEFARSMEDGRLRFHLHSFSSFNVAKTTIKALWEARSLSPAMKLRIAEEESEGRAFQSEEAGGFVGMDDAKIIEMAEIFSSCMRVDLASLMVMFDGGETEMKVMRRVGCIDYSATPWEPTEADKHQRQIHYKFDKKLSPVGGEATSSQQRSPLPQPTRGWMIEEIMELQGVLFADFFTLHIRYQVEDLRPKKNACSVQVSLGVQWLKSTKQQKRVGKSVAAASAARVKSMFAEIGKEIKQQ